eukprot:m.143995 g.143995  ORF g.143995 m.143995 type:complete len:65 (+) comp38398_c1_seq3:1262-1456(+)
MLSNWKQCVWIKYDTKNTGLVYSCSFTKNQSGTSLKVSYAANIRVRCSGSECCGRWYFTFNSRE